MNATQPEDFTEEEFRSALERIGRPIPRDLWPEPDRGERWSCACVGRFFRSLRMGAVSVGNITLR